MPWNVITDRCLIRIDADILNYWGAEEVQTMSGGNFYEALVDPI